MADHTAFYRLGRLILNENSRECFETQLLEFLEQHGWKAAYTTYRNTDQVWRAQQRKEVQRFHHDGFKAWGQWSPKWIAVWSDQGGTMIRYPVVRGYRIFIARPFEVIVINNIVCAHKTSWFPAGTRQFMRASTLRPYKQSLPAAPKTARKEKT